MMGKALTKERNIAGMRKICVVSLMILLLLSLASCGKPKTALSSDEFQSQMNEAGYEVIDARDQFSDEDPVESVLLAIYENGSYQIEFYVFPTESDATQTFDNIKSRFESGKGSSSSYSSVTLSNYSKYTLTTNGEYSVISRIANTLIYVVTTDANKDAVNDTLKALGY